MAFKMKGSSMHSGTAGHRSATALKAKEDEKATSYSDAYNDNLKYKNLDKEGDYTKVDKYGKEYAGGSKGSAGERIIKGKKDFETAAKAWNMKTYGTHNPTADAKKGGMTKAELAKQFKASSTPTKTEPKTTPKPKAVDGAKRGVNQSGETTTSKNKGRTLVVSSGRTSGKSTVVNKDRKMKVDQTPSPDIKKVKRKDRKVAMEGMNRQERKNYRDLQDTKKDMRKQSRKDAKAKAKEVTGRGGKARRAKRADAKDAKINKKLLAAADKKANTQKAADALEKDVASSAMKKGADPASVTNRRNEGDKKGARIEKRRGKAAARGNTGKSKRLSRKLAKHDATDNRGKQPTRTKSVGRGGSIEF